MEFKIAAAAAEREAALRLVHHRYVQAHLDEDNPYGMRVTPHHLLDTTTIFVGKVHGEVVSTVTLVEDGELGLPMEAMYAEQVQQRRRMGLRLAEVACLADRRQDMRRFVEVFLSLTRLLAQFARRRGVDELVAAVHPKHAPFYRRFVGFQELAGLASCPHVRHNPSLGLFLSFAHCDEVRPRCYDAIFGDRVPDEQLQEEAIPAIERRFLEHVCDATHTRWPKLTA